MESFIERIGANFNLTKLETINPDYLDFELRYLTEDQANKLLELQGQQVKLDNKANSVLVYLLDLSDNYEFSKKIKFIAEGEGPDIDTDFCPHKVDFLIKRLQEKYGDDRVLRVSTYKPWSLKPAIKCFQQLLKNKNGEYYSSSDGIRIANAIPDSVRGKYMTYEELEADQFNNKIIKEHPRLFELCKTVDGNVNSQSIHASAVLIGTSPIDTIVPIRKVRAEENSWFNITQWEGPALEKLGFVKFDILHTDVLTINDLTCQSVGLKLSELEDSMPLDDPAVFDLINKGFTAGLFQMEETYLLKLIKDLKPKSLNDLALFSALNRPGPRDSGLLADYVTYKKTGIKQNKLHPLLDPILDETGGVLIYQEQVMAACQLLAGISLVEADRIRKAMGKKDQVLMNKYRQIFIDGTVKHHSLSEYEAEKIWNVIAAFAEYGFNKSHSLAYALITYTNAYLKTYYPTDFMLNLMTVRAEKPEKLVRYINEYRQMGFTIHPPDINYSSEGFTKIDNSSIYFGLQIVHGIGKSAAKAIIQNRNKNGPYKSFYNFIERIADNKVNAGAVGALAKAGAFDSFGYERAQLVDLVPTCCSYFRELTEYETKIDLVTARNAEILDYPAILKEWQDKVDCGVIITTVVDKKKTYSEPRPGKPRELTLPVKPKFPDLNTILKPADFKIPMQYVRWEFELCKFAISRHPLSFITRHPPGVIFDQIEDVLDGGCTKGNLLVAVSALVTKQIKSGASKGKEMATLTIEDYSSMGEVTLFAKQYEEMKDSLGVCSLLFFKYEAVRDGDFIKIKPVGKITII